MKSAIYILLVLPLACAAFNPTCKVQKTLTGTYTFKGSTLCQYIMIAPIGSKVNMQCSFSLANQGTCDDSFIYSTSGDFSRGYSYYCGSGTFDMVSTADRFAVGSDFKSTQSNFTCTAYISTPLAAGQCDCGWKPQSRISGGATTGVNEYIFMATITSSTTIISVGTIISTRHVLTTASSLAGYTVSSVLVGDHDRKDYMEAPSTKEYGLQNIVIHPQYNEASRQNDIAILYTQTDIKFGVTVGPACLPFNLRTNQFVSNAVVGVGWGGVDALNAGSYSNVVKAATFTVLSNADCQSRLPINVLSANQICSYSDVNDLCVNDAGGPLLYWNSAISRNILVGMISYGLQCSPLLPGVNTRITPYLNWIESQTSGTTFCKK